MLVSILILCKNIFIIILIIIVIIIIHLIFIFNQVGYIFYCTFRSRALRAGGGGGGGLLNHPQIKRISQKRPGSGQESKINK